MPRKAISPDHMWRIPPFTVENVCLDLPRGLPWGISLFNIPHHWLTTEGEGIRVGLADTGTSPHHPDLKGQIADMRDFSGSKSGPIDQNSHGTHCFTEDTKISLLDGTERTLKELESYNGQIWVYSYSHKTGIIVPGKASKPFKTGSKVKVLKITIDQEDGSAYSVRCTEDHRWLMRYGKYRKACKLKVGDSLMPLYRRLSTKEDRNYCPKYEMVFHPGTEKFKLTHRSFYKFITTGFRYINRELIQTSCLDNLRTIHHIKQPDGSFNIYDNRPSMLSRMINTEHTAYHRANPGGFCNWTAERHEVHHLRMKALNKIPGYFKHSDPEVNKRRTAKSSRTMKKLHQDPEFAKRRDIRSGNNLRKLHQNEEFAKKNAERASKLISEVNNNPELARKFQVSKCEKTKKILIENGYDPETQWDEGRRELKRLGKLWRNAPKFKSYKRYNHKVISVEEAGYEDVYDITVEEYHNFALSAGVFVHNCAGILAASRSNTGMIGVAPKCKLYVAKVLRDDGVGSNKMVANGIKWLIDSKVDIINLSLGSPVPDPGIHEMIKYAYGKNIPIICAAGNSGPRINSVQYPAKWPETISIGSIDRNKKISDFSSRGEEVQFVCPGSDIYSCYPPNTYALLSGTSMASPFASGVIALALARFKKGPDSVDLSNQASLIKVLRESAVHDPATAHSPDYGYGLINPDALIPDLSTKTISESTMSSILELLASDFNESALPKIKSFFPDQESITISTPEGKKVTIKLS